MSNLSIVSRKTVKTSGLLLGTIRRSYIIERRLEDISLQTRKKLVEKRRSTLKSLDVEKSDRDSGGVGGILTSLLGGRAAGGLIRRFRGGGGPRGGGWNPFKPKGPRLPSNNIRPTSGLLRGSKGARGLRGFRGLRGGGLGPLAVLTTGLDFMGRKADGQTNLQAGVGAGGGLVGALAGGAAGAKAGAIVGGSIGALFGGVGAAPGAAIGGFIGGVGGSIIGSGIGSSIADFFTGADDRRQQAVQAQAIEQMVTPFSKALDKFDQVLDKLQRVGLPSNPELVEREKDRDRIFSFPGFVPTTPFWKSDWFRLTTELGIAIGITLIPWDAWFGDVVAWAKVADTARKIPLLRRLFKAGQLVKFNKPVTTIVPVSKPGQIVLSKKGQIVLSKKGELTLARDWKLMEQLKKIWQSLTNAGKKAKFERSQNLEVQRRIQEAMLELEKRGYPWKIPRTIRKTYSKKTEVKFGPEKLLHNIKSGEKVLKKINDLTKPKEDGGPVIAGKPYKVGEAGEELFIPAQHGVIVPNWALGSDSPITIVNNNGQTIVNSPIVASRKGGGGGTSRANPYLTATKYAQMTSLMTV